MTRRIIVPLDGSKAAESALVYAAAIPGDRVVLLACLPAQNEFLSRTVTGGEGSASRQLWASTNGYLEQQSGSLNRQGREVDLLVETGDPAEIILKTATADDLIVMTTHGAGAGTRVVFGSVADRVVRHAVCPVLVVRGGDRPVIAAPISRIVVPLDGSDRSEAAVPLAIELATDLGVPVRLLRALDISLLQEAVRTGTYAAAANAGSVVEIRAAIEKSLDEQADAIRNLGVSATTAVLDGPAGRTLLAAFETGDFVVMTSHGRGGFRRWVLGSVADKLVRGAIVPVLITRSQ